MSITRGTETRRKRFMWRFSEASKQLLIVNQNGREHSYSLQEVTTILNEIHRRFGQEFFPLANNVEKLGNGTEKPGLGTVILDQRSSTVSHAQGASYLGVVLEECGYLHWNGKHIGIEWRLIDTDFSLETISSRLAKPGSKEFLRA